MSLKIPMSFFLAALLTILPACGESQPKPGSPSASATPDQPPESLSAVDCIIQGEQAWANGDRAAALKLYDEAIKKTADNPPQMQIFQARKSELAKAAQ